MRRQRKSKTPISSGKLSDRGVRWAPQGSHPSQVSGMFKKDPTFKEFRKILRQQRQEDYRRANKEIDVRDFVQVPNLKVEDWTTAPQSGT
jgi:hypothetical protein